MLYHVASLCLGVTSFVPSWPQKRPKSSELFDMKRSGSFINSPARAVKRQQSLAGFFGKTEKRPPAPEVIVVNEEIERRGEPTKISPEGAANSDPSPSYPPTNHPSYHLPPSPTFNHPFLIPPIPLSLDLAFNTNATPHLNPSRGLDILYLKRFIDPSCSFELTKYFLEALPWHHVKYTVRGLDINTPRFTTVFGRT